MNDCIVTQVGGYSEILPEPSGNPSAQLQFSHGSITLPSQGTWPMCSRTPASSSTPWGWAGWTPGHSALFSYPQWAYFSPLRFNQSFPSLIIRCAWIAYIQYRPQSDCFDFFCNLVFFKVLAVFLTYSRTTVVMASGRELCYVLLLGESLNIGLKNLKNLWNLKVETHFKDPPKSNCCIYSANIANIAPADSFQN